MLQVNRVLQDSHCPREGWCDPNTYRRMEVSAEYLFGHGALRRRRKPRKDQRQHQIHRRSYRCKQRSVSVSTVCLFVFFFDFDQIRCTCSNLQLGDLGQSYTMPVHCDLVSDGVDVSYSVFFLLPRLLKPLIVVIALHR